jgi:hypothetical protein
MASQGYFVAAVEHRDGSAAATMIIKDGEKEFIYERKLQPEEKVLKILGQINLISITKMSNNCPTVFRKLIT